ncbi:RCN2 [Branchiostoma lanceolatum]|uniref:Reticulocalbin-3 n=1 Tax=Branchiostoma lanceolatum TaxID=7740 RepID=A0A8K0A995_BRALA|nr:RCN2 [Branchiostoma lanceolatum]
MERSFCACLLLLWQLSIATCHVHIHESHYPDHYVDGDHDAEFDREILLGGKKEAEEYQKLSPEESKQRLMLLVKKIDVNGDGLLDRDELVDHMLESFNTYSVEEAKETFPTIDLDEDGKVSWEEYLQDTFGAEYVSTDGNPAEDEMIQDDRRFFQEADEDHDGKLDEVEWLAFQHPEEYVRMHHFLVEEKLEESDWNEDGLIDFDEYLGDDEPDSSYSGEEEWRIVEREQFDEYDKDRDGLLDGEEVAAWVTPNHREAAEEEADHLLSMADTNTDDKLSAEEIMSDPDLFLQSDLTEQGELLHTMDHQEL